MSGQPLPSHTMWKGHGSDSSRLQHVEVPVVTVIVLPLPCRAQPYIAGILALQTLNPRFKESKDLLESGTKTSKWGPGDSWTLECVPLFLWLPGPCAGPVMHYCQWRAHTPSGEKQQQPKEAFCTPPPLAAEKTSSLPPYFLLLLAAVRIQYGVNRWSREMGLGRGALHRLPGAPPPAADRSREP
ncbi:Protocadherin Fat 4 [Manis pentadactyla]|nr:Protocadherin Fat 4 [Manis pentadactyla]